MVSTPKPSQGLRNPTAVVREGIRRAAHNPSLRSAAERIPISQTVIKHYVAGEDPFAAVRVSRTLLGAGRHVTLQNIRPVARTLQEAAGARDELLSLLDLLDKAGFAREGRAEISLRLSTLGQRLGADGPRIATGHAADLCARAAAIGTTITLDMEDHTTTDLTLESLRDLRSTYPWVGVVLQSTLRRTEGDCRALVGVGSRVRLVKGEYAEPATMAFTAPGDIDRAFARCLKILVRGSGYPMIATHDRRLIEIGQALMTHEGRTTDSYEFQMRHGIRVDEQKRLVALGETLRVHVPYGPDAYGWLVSRLARKPSTTVSARSPMRRG